MTCCQKKQRELPGEQLVRILIRPSNHLSEAVTSFLILLLTGSVLLLLLLLLWESQYLRAFIVEYM